jgi:hypothetical protein
MADKERAAWLCSLRDPTRGDYASSANFSDPDGNGWVLQERGYRNL